MRGERPVKSRRATGMSSPEIPIAISDSRADGEAVWVGNRPESSFPGL
jgi:hypothetical protein